MKRYPPQIRAEAKSMLVCEGKSAKEIAELYDHEPCVQTILNWAAHKNKEGKNWYDIRDEYEHNKYEALSPKGLAFKILNKINMLLNTDNSKFGVKDADAIAKLRVSLEKLTDKKYQIPMMYEVLTLFVKFLKQHYPEVVNGNFLNAVRHFKNSLKEVLD